MSLVHDTQHAAMEEDKPAAPSLTTYGIHHEFLAAFAQYVQSLQVRDKRSIYATMRADPPVTPNSFLPAYGTTVGEFTTFVVLSPAGRK